MARNRTENLPVLALRGRVVFPATTISFDVGRTFSLAALRYAGENCGSRVFVVAQKDAEIEKVTLENLFEVGTVAYIKQIARLPGNSVRVTVEGDYRAQIVGTSLSEGAITADVSELKPIRGEEALEEAYMRTSLDILKEICSEDPARFPRDIAEKLSGKDVEPERFVGVIAESLRTSVTVKQELLEEVRVIERLKMLGKVLNDELEIGRLEHKINATVRQNIEKNQKEYYLREQLRAIHGELGDDEDEKQELERRIKQKGMPEEVEQKALKELYRMDKMQQTSPDYNVLRMYLDWLLDLPWHEKTDGDATLEEAVKVLEEDHYGLEKVKERITEYFAVLKLTGGLNAPILCLVGPPGVGKTSIASSVARALKRKFVRMSLGGVKDEAEIRGHRKTYIGAIPGRIIAGMKNAGTIDPVFLLDEIDKLSSDMRGDPASALLEVLDPAQNSTFRDRYLEVPYDLSKVLFITTANSLDGIPRPLLDRMEVIELNGYTQEEKREIAKRYLVPKRVKANGLELSHVKFTDEALDLIIAGYTLEAGVRSLERQIDAVCRKLAVKIAGGDDKKHTVGVKAVGEYLGSRRYEDKPLRSEDEVGAATGLAWTAFGGVTLTIEVSAMHGKGNVMLTGKLGDVMQESARAAITYIRSQSGEYGIPEDAFETTDIHVHVPEGATPKDGPSAGITMACAILSAFTKKPVRHDVAMTGEITLRGKVLPIGGLKEKALAAYRAGIYEVIIPADNKKDLEEIPADVREKLRFIPVTCADAVFKNAIVGL